jgi:hypothetical protein
LGSLSGLSVGVGWTRAGVVGGPDDGSVAAFAGAARDLAVYEAWLVVGTGGVRAFDIIVTFGAVALVSSAKPLLICGSTY